MVEIENINIKKFELKLADSDDPIASKVSWSPAKPGGANFKTQILRRAGSKIIVERSGQAKLFTTVFVVPGFGALLIGAPWALLKGNVMLGFFLIVWGGLFGGIGWLVGRDKKFQFDKAAGVFYRGDAMTLGRAGLDNERGRLDSIHAIQLLKEQISSNSDSGHSNYFSYELNVVLKNGERVNVMDSGDAQDVENAAVQLANFLSVPVWKASY